MLMTSCHWQLWDIGDQFIIYDSVTIKLSPKYRCHQHESCLISCFQRLYQRNQHSIWSLFQSTTFRLMTHKLWDASLKLSFSLIIARVLTDIHLTSLCFLDLLGLSLLVFTVIAFSIVYVCWIALYRLVRRNLETFE